MLVRRSSPSSVYRRVYQRFRQSPSVLGLGGCFAKQKQNRSGKQCHANDKFNHAHILTPSLGDKIKTAIAARHQARNDYKS